MYSTTTVNNYTTYDYLIQLGLVVVYSEDDFGAEAWVEVQVGVGVQLGVSSVNSFGNAHREAHADSANEELEKDMRGDPSRLGGGTS